jgi:hypothetical protein
MLHSALSTERTVQLFHHGPAFLGYIGLPIQQEDFLYGIELFFA